MKKITLLVIILFSALTCLFSFGCASICVYETYANSENYKSGNSTFSASEIAKVNLNWYYGDIIVNSTNNEQVSISENSDTLQDNQKVHWNLENKILTIHFCKSGFNGSIDNNKKHLTLYVPNNIELNISSRSAEISSDILTLTTLSIDSASGEIDFESITADSCSITSHSGEIDIDDLNVKNDFSINSQSGEISIDNLASTNISISSQSGDVELQNIDTNKMDINTKSGEISLTIIDSNQGSIVSSSGNVNIKLLNNLGAKIKLTQSSGKLKCYRDYITSDDYVIIGNGNSLMNITTASGHVKIN